MAGDRERSAESSRLGSRIRTARQGRHSLEGLAARAGISAGLLSEIERGKGNPSYLTLLRIADALELPISTFFEWRGEPAGEAVVRGDRRAHVTWADGVSSDILVPDLDGAFAVFLTEFAPGYSGADAPRHHASTEFLLVLEGELEVAVGLESHTLAAGDSITYDANRPHSQTNRGPMPARALVVVAPPHL